MVIMWLVDGHGTRPERLQGIAKRPGRREGYWGESKIDPSVALRAE
jgi:hypothetical protein